MNKTTFGQRLRILLKELKLTRIEFGMQVGLSATTIQNFLNDAVKPRKSNLVTICDTYKVNIEWLSNGIGSMFIGEIEVEKSNLKPDGQVWVSEVLAKLEAEIVKKDKEIERLWALVDRLAAPAAMGKAETLEYSLVLKEELLAA